jgi:hypothetical protein
MSTLMDVVRKGTTRGLDFIAIDELRKRTGVSPSQVLRFALGEMICNALDKDDVAEISVQVKVFGDFHQLSIADNGSKKITREELELILDFNNKASSKRGFLRVSRGYLGNALKCIFGYSYALAEAEGLKPPTVIVESGGSRYAIALRPDRISETINHEVETTAVEDDGYTTFTVKFPKDGVEADPKALKEMVFATHIVNPSRRIVYDILGEEGALGSAERSNPIRRETSVLWYNSKQFTDLFNDFLRTVPDARLGDFIALFRGFSKVKQLEKLQEPNNAGNHDSGGTENLQFFPGTPIRDLPAPMTARLYAVLKTKSRPIGRRSIPSVLGVVGQASFEKIRERNGWKRLRYVMMPGIRVECPQCYPYPRDMCGHVDRVEIPYVIELALFDRGEDGEGLRVYQCVNFMASMEDLFARIYNISYHLGRAGIGRDSPVTVVVHLVCPVLKWLNYGKSGLDE